MGVPPGNRPAVPRDWFRGVPERYVAGADTQGRPEGRPYPWSQQAIHETSGLASGNLLKQLTEAFSGEETQFALKTERQLICVLQTLFH
jgi:hypothetical protein